MKILYTTTAVALALTGAVATAQAAGTTDNNNNNNGNAPKTQAVGASQATTKTGTMSTASTQPKMAAAGQTWCGQGWGMIDANGDGMISPAEAAAHMKASFKAMDKNGDGSISQSEYDNCITATNGLKSAEVKRGPKAFKAADANSDKSISRKEYSSSAEKAFKTAKASPKDAKAQKRLDRYLWLSSAELPKINDQISDMSPDEIAGRAVAMFDALDTNHDGKLSEKEWEQGSVASAYDNTWAEASFKDMDADHNGSLTEKEFQTAQTMSFDPVTTASTKAGTSDKDTSGAKTADSDTAVPPGMVGDQRIYDYRFGTLQR